MRLSFTTDRDKTLAVSVNNCDTNYEPDKVLASMVELIDCGAVYSESLGKPKVIKYAKYYEVKSIVYNF